MSTTVTQTPPPGQVSGKSLFSRHYLESRLAGQPEWSEDPWTTFAAVRTLWLNARTHGGNWNEAQTEDEFIKPVLEALGWSFIVQAKATRGGRVNRPDYALFTDDAAKHAAYPQQGNDASAGARLAGNDRNLRQLTAIDPDGLLPVIMGGDFNCNRWSPVYRTLLGAGFVDAYRAAGHADSVEASTFHGFHGANYFALEWGVEVYWRVDWIMVRAGTQPIQTTSCTIVRDAEPPVFVSDHYPVVAELLIGE